MYQHQIAFNSTDYLVSLDRINETHLKHSNSTEILITSIEHQMVSCDWRGGVDFGFNVS